MGCSGTLVQGNLIENHYKGIMCSEADHSLITHNVIRDNTHSGIMFAIGCDRNTISYNIIEGNNESGILIEYSSCSMTTIENNDFINNTVYGVASIGPWTRILHNYITGSEYGIAMQGHYSTIHSNNLMNNKLGVQIETAAPSDVTDNIFIGNSLDASFSDMFFEHFLYFFVYQPRLIRWSGNYWGEPLSQPKIISGTMVIFGMHIPWVNVDFRPASEPQGTWRTQ